MWTCPTCGRAFGRQGQSHSCRTMALEQHFRNKATAKGLFDQLCEEINSSIGQCEVISLPCCIHLCGKYDFLAAFPRRDRLEISVALDRPLEGHRVRQSVAISATSYRSCVDLRSRPEIDEELMAWLAEAYHLRDKQG